MTTTDDAAEVLVVRRQIPFPREQVFAAWLDGASLAQWMRPGGASRRRSTSIRGSAASSAS